MARKRIKRNPGDAPTGIDEIDRLTDLPSCSLADYIKAVSSYVRQQARLSPGPKKAAQIRLSNALGKALILDLKKRLPSLGDAFVGEKKVAGALRTTNADVSETHPLDGLRLAVELKPVNLAVGRAIWNRFGDLRTFAVNLHIKFPFAVVGGVLVVPTYEEAGTEAARKAQATEELAAKEDGGAQAVLALSEPVAEYDANTSSASRRKSSRHLIERAVERLVRAGGRRTEGDAPHLLEGIAVVAYNPDAGRIDRRLPRKSSGLRWENFIDLLAKAYEARFES